MKARIAVRQSPPLRQLCSQCRSERRATPGLFGSTSTLGTRDPPNHCLNGAAEGVGAGRISTTCLSRRSHAASACKAVRSCKHTCLMACVRSRCLSWPLYLTQRPSDCVPTVSLGATLGDSLTKDHADGGLELVCSTPALTVLRLMREFVWAAASYRSRTQRLLTKLPDRPA